MKKNIITIAFVVIIIGGYIFSGKYLDKKFADDYDIKSIVGIDRYETAVLAGKNDYTKVEEGMLINTENITEAISAISFANSKNIPIFFTKPDEISIDTWSRIKELEINHMYIVGGIKSVSRRVERSVNRAGVETERITDVRGFDVSLRILDMLYSENKFDTIALCSKLDIGLSEGVSMAIAGSRENIPVIAIDESNIYDVVSFIKEKNIKNTYIVGDESKIPETVDKLVPSPERIYGIDSYETNRIIIEKFYDMDNVDEIYAAKGGTFMYGTNLQIGEFVNSISVANTSADKNIPILFFEENYMEKGQYEFIEKYNIKNIISIGFKLEREDILNPDKLRTASAIVLILISIIILFRSINNNKKKKIKIE